MPFSLKLFGGASLAGPGGLVAGSASQRRRLALLALLSLARDGTLSRDKLVGYLWPELDAERARHNLAVAVHALRAALGDDAIATGGDDVRLDRRVVVCDASEFESALDRGDIDRACALYTDPLLDGVHLGGDAPEFDRWADRERARLADRYALALEQLAEQRTGRGELKEAVEAWRRRVALDPYSERAALGLMRALERAGDRAGAIQHARIHTTLLREDLESDPDPEVTAFAERLRSAPQAMAAAARPEEARARPPGAIEERYAVGRATDEGRVVTTYEARDLRTGGDVHLHVLNPSVIGIARLDQVLRVLQRVAALEHPHVLSPTDYGAAGDALYYATPRTGGMSLRERLARESPLPIEEAQRIALHIAEALAYAHGRSVRHGDLRPKHVHVTATGAMVRSFGVVEALGAQAGGGPAGTGVTIGAPAYLSPEQLTGDGMPDDRSDIYSFGCVLYEMLAGELPFGSDRMSSISRKLTQAPPSLRAVRESVPVAVDEIARRCLARMPADRYRTADELCAALTGN